MPDREKAIKGLERHANGNCAYDQIIECPYWGDSHCSLHLCSDVLALLKAQEPVKPILDSRAIEFYRCGQCNEPIDRCDNYCWSCGRAVKWDG